MKFKLLSVLGCLLTVGCIEVKDQNEKKSKAIEVSQITFDIEPLAQPQAYLVRFSGLNCNLNFKRTSTLKSRISTELKNCEDLVNESGSHLYEWVEDGLVKSMTVNIPEDKIIEGTVQLSQLNPVDFQSHGEIKKHVKISGRLYFRAASKLVTNGESVLIETDLIHSEGASIMTFENGSKANDGTHGQSGGLIHLRAKKIVGAFRVELRGQNGGNGENQFTSRKQINSLILNGSNGGNSGRFWLESLDLNQSQINIIKEPGAGGQGTGVPSMCIDLTGNNPCRPSFIRPIGPEGLTGYEERSCLIVNQKCEALNLN